MEADRHTELKTGRLFMRDLLCSLGRVSRCLRGCTANLRFGFKQSERVDDMSDQPLNQSSDEQQYWVIVPQGGTATSNRTETRKLKSTDPSEPVSATCQEISVSSCGSVLVICQGVSF